MSWSKAGSVLGKRRKQLGTCQQKLPHSTLPPRRSKRSTLLGQYALTGNSELQNSLKVDRRRKKRLSNPICVLQMRVSGGGTCTCVNGLLQTAS